jgi:hypothetical protein
MARTKPEGMQTLEIIPTSALDVLEGVISKGEQKDFTPTEVEMLLAFRFEGQPVFRIAPQIVDAQV